MKIIGGKSDIFLGRNKYGEKYYLNFEVRERESGITTNHEQISNYLEVAFNGVLTSKRGSYLHQRGWVSCGQNYEHLLDITEPAKGFTLKTIREIYDLWRTYHLNDMKSHCTHQDKSVKWDEVAPCQLTGYKAGSAWLVEPISQNQIAEIMEKVSA